MPDDVYFKTSAKLLEFLEIYHEELIAIRSEIVGIQEAQYRLLFHLKNCGPMSMSALGNSLYFTKAYMTTLVDTLTKEGLVERRPDPGDRRVIHIHITDTGREKIAEANLNLQRYLMGKMSTVTPPEMKDLLSSIEKILEIFKKYKG